MKQRGQRVVARLIAVLVVAILFFAAGAAVKAQPDAECSRNAQLCVWRDLRDGLTGDQSRKYWEALQEVFVPGGIRGADKFKGKLISASPETKPTELLLAVDGTAADAKIQLIEALPGRMPVGSEIQFAGTAAEFSKSPYMLTLESDTVDIEGWTGK